jgi:hypothetical protein
LKYKSSKRKRKILFLSTNHTTINEHINLCNLLDERFDKYLYAFESLENYYIDKSISVIESIDSNKSKLKLTRNETSFIKSKILERIKLLIVNTSAYYLLKLNTLIKFEKSKIPKANSLFNHLEQCVVPDVVVVPNDRSEILILLLIKKFKLRNIKTVIVPTSFLSGPERLIACRNNRIEYTTNLHLFFFKNFKKLYFEIDNKKICFYPLHQMIVFRSDVLSPNPWAIGSGNIDEIFVDGNHTKNTLNSLGVKSKKIIITGHHSHDRIFNNIVNKKKKYEEFVEKNRTSKNKKILVIALPHFGEHGLLSWDDHFKLIDLVCNTVSQLKDIFVLVSLHPKMNKTTYSFINEKFNLKICDKPLVEIIHLADYFISTYSSTVYWALLCKIKCGIINFNILNYSDIDWIGFLKVFNSKSNFNSEILDFIQNSKFDVNVNVLTDIAPFDGNSTMRISNRLLSI